MTIPTPQLDDRDFESLVAEARTWIRRAAPQWTDLSPSDPGMVLVELFAHLTDLMLYRLNQVPEKAYVEFLRLMGLTLQPPTAASVMLRFEREKPAERPIRIPAGTRATTTRGGNGTEPPVFATIADVELAAGETAVESLARHAERVVAERVGEGSGLPGQSVETSRKPIVAPAAEGVDLIVGVATTEELEARVPAIEHGGVTYRVWEEVDSFINRGPEDPVYVVDRTSGTITFAPAIRLPTPGEYALADEPAALAGVPASGAEIRVWYSVGGGPEGNVGPDLLTVIKGQVGGIRSVTNPAPATGGRAGESVANALARGPQQLHAIERAMTAADYEAAAKRAARGVARARAYSQESLWRHAVPGTVEVLLVPYVPGQEEGAGPLSLQQLVQHQTDVARTQVEAEIDERRPLGTRRVVKWTRYKCVWAKVRVVVRREESREAVEGRVAQRLNGTINPLPTPVNPTGWQFGQALRASDIYDIVLKEPGVRFADQVRLVVEGAPAVEVKAIAVDAFQPHTWYAGAGSTLYRSVNDGEGWEAMVDFEGEAIEVIQPHQSVPGLVAVAAKVEGGARLHLSFDAGESWDPFEARKPEFEVSDIAWVGGRDAPTLLLATDVGLFELKAIEGATVVQITIPESPSKGFYAIAAATDALGNSQVAVAARDSGGVFLSDRGGAPDSFRATGLKGRNVRTLRIQHEVNGTRAWLWAGAAAAGENDPGTGASRWELRGAEDPVDKWVDFKTNWSAGGCWDLAFLDSTVFAASYRGGVLRLDASRSDAGWQAMDVNAGLPLRGPGAFLFLQLDAVAANQATGRVMAGGPKGVFASTDAGVIYEPASETEFLETVELPSNWLFVSGRHEIEVVQEAGP